MKTFILTLLFILIPAFCLASDFETRKVSIQFTYDPPPDLAKYVLKCTEDDANAVDISLSEVTSVNATAWKITDKQMIVTAGKARCWMQAVDAGGQTSGWSEPSGWADYKPLPVLHLNISSPDAIIVIGE